MRRLLAFAVPTVMILVLAVAGADPHGACELGPLGIVDVGGVAYIEDRTAASQDPMIILWAESNGAEGLQRDGFCGFIPPCHGGACFDDSDFGPDTILVDIPTG
jgi:hypothetical protein